MCLQLNISLFFSTYFTFFRALVLGVLFQMVFIDSEMAPVHFQLIFSALNI